MKKAITILILTLLLLECSFAEEEKSIDLNAFKLGMGFSEIAQIIEAYEVPCDMFSEEPMYIKVPINAFDEVDSFGADLNFNEDGSLKSIRLDLHFDYVHEAYKRISSELGGADIVYIADYIDHEINDGYVDSSYPSYMVWVEDNAIYELEISTLFYTECYYDFFSGLEFKVDDSPTQLFDLFVYNPDMFDERSYLYE